MKVSLSLATTTLRKLLPKSLINMCLLSFESRILSGLFRHSRTFAFGILRCINISFACLVNKNFIWIIILFVVGIYKGEFGGLQATMNYEPGTSN